MCVVVCFNTCPVPAILQHKGAGKEQGGSCSLLLKTLHALLPLHRYLMSHSASMVLACCCMVCAHSSLYTYIRGAAACAA
jgi:hypothetical protein